MLQKQLGQFYTTKNIFKNAAFIKWFNQIPANKKENILEPFAGSNGIIHLLDKLGFIKQSTSYDIMPRHKDVILKDTLLDFPSSFSTCITNPPFLAKNSASRRSLSNQFENFNDLYELCLDRCLQYCEYVAAIIPESFITNQLFDKNRLVAIISLAEKNIFKDTEHPVCLALFNPEKQEDFNIYINDDLVGSYQNLVQIETELLALNSHDELPFLINWHSPKGQIGLECIDATNKKRKIHFTKGECIDEAEINFKSRLRTRIEIKDKNGKLLKKSQVNQIIKELNQYLETYRMQTQDVFLTAFKGLRTDGFYRRRLDFTKARLLVNAALINKTKDI